MLPAGTDPEQLAVSQDGRWLFVANEDAAQTSVIDATNGTIHATIKWVASPKGWICGRTARWSTSPRSRTTKSP